jgi:hypothetical protein
VPHSRARLSAWCSVCAPLSLTLSLPPSFYTHEAPSTQASSRLVKSSCSFTNANSFGCFPETFKNLNMCLMPPNDQTQPTPCLCKVRRCSLRPDAYSSLCLCLVADAAHQHAPFVCGHVQVVLFPALTGLALATHHPTSCPLHLP